LVGAGLIASWARPGGNLTGISTFGIELHPKRFEILTELVPNTTVIGLIVNPNNQATKGIISDILHVTRAREIKLEVVESNTDRDFDTAFNTLRERHVGALIIADDTLFDNKPRREQLVELTARYALPAIHALHEWTIEGGLISYGPSVPDIWHQAGVYTGKILKGETPANMPIQQPTKIKLVINLKTATALGVAVPQSLLARADEVIE
jgi:putative ABC transport system substrate-binding protein